MRSYAEYIEDVELTAVEALGLVETLTVAKQGGVASDLRRIIEESTQRRGRNDDTRQARDKRLQDLSKA